MKNRTLHYIIRFLVGDDVPSELVETIEIGRAHV